MRRAPGVRAASTWLASLCVVPRDQSSGDQPGARPAVDGTASWGRRALALLVDWVACTLVVLLFVGPDTYYASSEGGDASPLTGLLTPLTYWVEASVLTSLVGGSFGQLVCGVRVVRLVGRGGLPLPLLPSLGRHLLVLLVIPPLVFRPDGRGLHDMATGSAAMSVAWIRDHQAG